MFKRIKNKYNELISFKEKNKVIPLTKLSIIMLIILDIFVYSSINMGIDFQTKVINNPNNKYTYECRNIVNNINLDKTNINSLKNFDNYLYSKDKVNHYNYNYGYSFVSYNNILDKELDNRCKYINDNIDKIKGYVWFDEIKNNNKTLNELYNNKLKEVTYVESNYNTVLIEKIADQNINKSIVNMNLDINNVKFKYETLIKERDSLLNKIKENKELFENKEELKDLISYVENNKQIVNDYNDDMRYYYIKIALLSIMFTLPLVLFFYNRMNKHNKLGNYSKYMINKNLLLVSSIPLISYVLKIVVNIIPHTFLNKVIDFLYNLNIPFVAYYILIGIIVLITTYFIIKIQNKKEVEQTKINFVEFYNKNICSKCNNKINYLEMNYCPHCSNKIKEDCLNCGNKKIVNLNHCHHCGK